MKKSNLILAVWCNYCLPGFPTPNLFPPSLFATPDPRDFPIAEPPTCQPAGRFRGTEAPTGPDPGPASAQTKAGALPREQTDA